MKAIKLFLLMSLGVFIFTSCEKNPDLSDLDGKNTVKTNYADGTNFSAFSSFYVNDTVYVLGGDQAGTSHIQKWIYGEDSNATTLIDKVAGHLKDRGYTQITNKAQKGSADLGLQISYVEDMNYYISSSYPYWWDWYYWGGWYPYYPYYPYTPVVYSYATGTLLVDMFNNKVAPTPGPDGRTFKTILWNAQMVGLLTGNNEYDGQLALEGLDQAFEQSPYLHK